MYAILPEAPETPPWKVASFGHNLTNGISSSFSLGIQPKHPSFLVKCPCKQGRKWLCIFSLPPVVFFCWAPGRRFKGLFFSLPYMVGWTVRKQAKIIAVFGRPSFLHFLLLKQVCITIVTLSLFVLCCTHWQWMLILVTFILLLLGLRKKGRRFNRSIFLGNGRVSNEPENGRRRGEEGGGRTL